MFSKIHFGCTFKPQAPYSQAPKPFTHQSSHALTIFILFSYTYYSTYYSRKTGNLKIVAISNQFSWISFPRLLKKWNKNHYQNFKCSQALYWGQSWLCCCTLTFRILHVKNLKCKNFLIDFLNELDNFKQKIFLHFKL